MNLRIESEINITIPFAFVIIQMGIVIYPANDVVSPISIVIYPVAIVISRGVKTFFKSLMW